jgi:hypothetical protein
MYFKKNMLLENNCLFCQPSCLVNRLSKDQEPIRKPRLSQKMMGFKVLTKDFFDSIAALRFQKNTKSGS